MAEQPTLTLSPPRKRTLEDDTANLTTTPLKSSPPSETSTPLTELSTQPSPSASVKAAARQPSPAPSSNGSVSSSRAAGPSTTSTQPTKRRKLTAKEKEEQRQEKETKAKAKAELKAQKEDEKRMKDEEKRKKNEEKEEKKRAKELEIQHREEEKRKKERSQMRLGSFFVKKQKTEDTAGGNGSSVEDVQTTEPILLSASSSSELPANAISSPQKSKKAGLSEYERFFLPFELPPHAILAPQNFFLADQDAFTAARERLDQLSANEGGAMELDQPATLKNQLSLGGRRGFKVLPMCEIIDRLNGSSIHPIDLTENGTRSQEPMDLLKEIPMKYLYFQEDVRPPYYGTYTKSHSQREALHLARNPFSRTLRQTDYDYDSEAEWEEPEEGEDLDSEGEDDLDEEGEDDMEGFLDDEEDAQVKRRLISGDLEPVSSGLCWENNSGVSILHDGSGAICTEFKEMKLGILLEPRPQSIDPFSTAYWDSTPTASETVTVSSKQSAGPNQPNGLMNPPRLPLANRPNSMVNGMSMFNVDQQSSKMNGAATVPKAAKPAKRMVPQELLQEFKDAVKGSDLTKIALVEALKKKFPKQPKDAINNTLSAVAQRVGAKEVEKRWTLK